MALAEAEKSGYEGLMMFLAFYKDNGGDLDAQDKPLEHYEQWARNKGKDFDFKRRSDLIAPIALQTQNETFVRLYNEEVEVI